MKVVATADTHGELPWIQECDLAIFAGDVCPINDHDVFYQYRWLKDTWIPYLRKLPAKDVVWIFGNHDFIGDNMRVEEPKIFQDLSFLWDQEKDSHIHFLNNTSVTIDGFHIFGYPYVGGLSGWAFNREPEELEEMASLIPPCDILVTHAPPFGSGDKAQYKYHVGDRYLAENLERISPKVVICGHIHEAYGVYKSAYVEHGIHSVSYLNERYEHKLHRHPTLINL
jgi:Icc-related predicted phosphoesterase